MADFNLQPLADRVLVEPLIVTAPAHSGSMEHDLQGRRSIGRVCRTVPGKSRWSKQIPAPMKRPYYSDSTLLNVGFLGSMFPLDRAP